MFSVAPRGSASTSNRHSLTGLGRCQQTSNGLCPEPLEICSELVRFHDPPGEWSNDFDKVSVVAGTPPITTNPCPLYFFAHAVT
jgi:hypothetical protein